MFRKLFSWRAILWIVRGICVALILFNLYFYFDQERWIFEPQNDPTGYKSTQEQTFAAFAIEGWLSPPQKLLSRTEATSSSPEAPEVAIHFRKFTTTTIPANGVVLYFHGNRGNLEKCRWEIEPFLQAGYDVWMMDYRQYGESRGAWSETALVRDAEMFYQYLTLQVGVKEQDLIVWGRSFGSGIAGSVAANNSPKLLVLETPYCSLPDAVRGANPFLLPCVFRYRLPTFEYLDYIKCPMHLIHGDSDEKISHTSSGEIAKRCRQLGVDVQGPHLIKGGKHNLRESKPQFDRVLNTILK